MELYTATTMRLKEANKLYEQRKVISKSNRTVTGHSFIIAREMERKRGESMDIRRPDDGRKQDKQDDCIYKVASISSSKVESLNGA